MGISPLCQLDNSMKPQKWGLGVQKSYEKTTGSVPDYVKNTVEQSTRVYPNDKILEGLDIESYNAFNEDIAVVTFYFPTHVATEITTNAKMTWLDYLSQVGGLLGLFLGCSVISMSEFVYWFTAVYFMKRKEARRNQKSNRISQVAKDSSNRL